ncbi:LysR family transcriptional regulator [Pararhizobium mangrovi]|uniref:LysR family transcriptional regulator n=1 Tax=Pararhizobium mangrovi TaxID=2590452 RepID=A0A506U5F5_9HYPH|nr:LysR family transcriptional regulator [Pararhizobium mangrovi]TPW28195.1 LysR family transcriptional regulator [Pararhizobium mangrovi]
MDWDDGRLFLTVARAGQMLGAARTLGVNQATLSRRIAALEASLGASLLTRHAHGCELTEDGEALAASLERAEAEFVQAQARFNGSGRTISGTLRIGAPDGFGVSFLAPRLGDFAERHPHLTIQLVAVPQAFSLSRREADIAVMVGRPEQKRLVARKLTDYTLGLYASRGYAEAHGLPRSPEDLRAHRLVGYVEDLIFSTSLNFTDAFWPSWRSRVEISSATGQMEAIRAGCGIGVLHDYLALPHGDLVPVLPALSAKRAYWLVYHESVRRLARIRAAVDFLTEIVGSESARFAAREHIPG